MRSDLPRARAGVFRAIFSILLCTIAASPSLAQLEFGSPDGLSGTLSIEAAVAAFDSGDTNFGTGRVDLRTAENTGDASWTEGYVKPILDLTLGSGADGQVYGGLAAVATATRGDGDAGGFTNDEDDDVDDERVFIGWRSGSRLAELGEDAVDISAGKQEFQVADGFLLYDGNLDQFEKAAYWLAPRKSFENTAIFRLNTSPVRADLFWLDSDEDQDETELAGLNAEHVSEDWGTLGMMYFTVLDSTPAIFGPRDGMDVLDFRVNDLRPTPSANLSLWAEYVDESGSGKDGDFDANGWYVEARYTLADIRWTPTISYRYAEFSGDPNPADGTRADFEPFFYGFSRGWGTWFQGEVTGEYLLFNNNQRNHMLQLQLAPTDSLGVGVIFWNFELDQRNYFGTPVTSKEFTDEVNIYADWTISERFFLTGLYGIASPNDGAREIFGADDDYSLFEIALYAYF